MPRSGSIHGRFQVFHNNHLKYALKSFESVDFMYVGLTAYDILFTNNRNHRFNLLDNPLAFYERVEMVTKVLVGAGIGIDSFTVVPFPIERPWLLSQYIPSECKCYTSIKDQWNNTKIDILRKQGYDVGIVDINADRIDGFNVRRLIRERDKSWRLLVPCETQKMVDEIHLAERMLQIENDID